MYTMRYKIGIFGSGNSSRPGQDLQETARQVGQALGHHAKEVIVVTGACTSLPYIVAHEAAASGADVWGFSPVASLDGQNEFTPNDDLSIYTKLLFLPAAFARS